MGIFVHLSELSARIISIPGSAFHTKLIMNNNTIKILLEEIQGQHYLKKHVKIQRLGITSNSSTIQ